MIDPQTDYVTNGGLMKWLREQNLPFTKNTLNAWRSLGRGPPYLKFGNKIFYRIASVREWLAKQERHPGRQPITRPLRLVRIKGQKPGGGR